MKPITLLKAGFIQKMRLLIKIRYGDKTRLSRLQVEIHERTLHLNVEKSEAYLEPCQTSTIEPF